MLKRKVIREEHPETGALHKQSIRFDGEWQRVIEGNTIIQIMLGEEELVHNVISIPKGKILHMRITVAGIQTDPPPEKIEKDKGA